MNFNVESLENRTLFTAALAVSQMAVVGGTELQITGTSAADHIVVTKTTGVFAISRYRGAVRICEPFYAEWITWNDRL